MRRFAISTALALLTPAVALAAPRTFNELVEYLVTIIDAGTGILIVAGVAIYIASVSLGLRNAGDKNAGKVLKEYTLWGLGILFVMVSIWGILRLLQSTLFGENPYVQNSGAGDSSVGTFDVPEFSE